MRLTLEITITVTSLLLILLVLLHRGKGGGLSSLFGGGVQSSLSGSTQAERNLNRITVFICLVWVISIVGVGYDIKRKTEQNERESREILENSGSVSGGRPAPVPQGGAPAPAPEAPAAPQPPAPPAN